MLLILNNPYSWIQTWNHHFWRRILSELPVLLLGRISWITVYNDCYFALLFLSSLPLFATFLLFLLYVVKSKYEWEKFICNVASPVVPSRESLWLLFPPMGSLWMTILSFGRNSFFGRPHAISGQPSPKRPQGNAVRPAVPWVRQPLHPQRWEITAFIPQAFSVWVSDELRDLVLFWF